MKGIFARATGVDELVREFNALSGVGLVTYTHDDPVLGRIEVVYHQPEWPTSPYFARGGEDCWGLASGWFFYKGALGDMFGLLRDFAGAASEQARQEVLRNVEAGAYVLILAVGDQRYIVTDPFGLHPHYSDEMAEGFTLAPAPYFLADGRDYCPELGRILATQNHLFGNYTAYKGLMRLDPGTVISVVERETSFYANYDANACSIEKALAGVTDLTEGFREQKRLLPLSGGLDSRLLLACGDFEYGFTFGPRDTGDRPIARKFSEHYEDFHEFSLHHVEYSTALEDLTKKMFHGVCAEPFVELMSVYTYLYKRWGHCIFYDGYLGDVLQRGQYLTYGGPKGALAKLFPRINHVGFRAETFLKKRYAKLGPTEQEMLLETFTQCMARFSHMDEYHRVVLFEFLYGRGSRYILNGGGTMAQQFFTSVQPFACANVFKHLFAADAYDSMSYKLMKDIWRLLPSEFSSVPTYSGYVPTWPHSLSRATMLATKALSRINPHGRAVSYDTELSEVRASRD